MIDIVDLNRTFAVAELQHVFDGRDQIIGAERHLGFGNRQPQLAVDAKAADATEAVAVGVLELFVKQRAGLVEGGGIARPQTLIDPDQRVFVAGSNRRATLRFVSIFLEAVHDERNLLLLHQFHSLQSRGADQLRSVVGDFAAGIDDNFAGPLALLGVDDVVGGDLAFQLDDAPATTDLLDSHFIEELEDLAVVGIPWVHGPQESQSGEFAALVDANLEGVFLGDIELDPAAAFGNDTAVVGFAVGRLGI